LELIGPDRHRPVRRIIGSVIARCVDDAVNVSSAALGLIDLETPGCKFRAIADGNMRWRSRIWRHETGMGLARKPAVVHKIDVRW
jgi:hypothetical protein